MDVNDKNLKEMHVLNTFEKLGVWWPHDTGNSVTGRIKYDGGHITLHLMLPLNFADRTNTLATILSNYDIEGSDASLSKIEYVRGILESGERVLLSNCMLVKSYTTNGVCNKLYRVVRMFAGDVNPETDMKGNMISIQYTSLYTWLWPSNNTYQQN